MKLAVALSFSFCGLLRGQLIQLHPQNPHYFLYQGKPIALVTSGEHYGSVMNVDFDYVKYLGALQADELNYTRIFGGSYREVPGKSFGIQRNTMAPADGRFLAPELGALHLDTAPAGTNSISMNGIYDFFDACTSSFPKRGAAASWWRLRCSPRTMRKVNGK